jgi:hypothetical protein
MPVDLRKYQTQTKFRLILWFVILLFTLGLGLIWLIYGRQAALLGLLCLLGTAIPIGLIVLALFGLDLIVKKKQ